MAITEEAVLLQSKTSDGTKRLLYPITTKDNVDGLEEVVDEKVTSHNGSETAHEDIRSEITDLDTKMEMMLQVPASVSVGDSLVVESINDVSGKATYKSVNLPVRNIEDATKFKETTHTCGFYFYLANPLPNGLYYYDVAAYDKLLYIVIVNSEGTAVDKQFCIYYPNLFYINSTDSEIVIDVCDHSGAMYQYFYNISDKTYAVATKSYTAPIVDSKLETKADTEHTHEFDDVSGLQTALDDKASQSDLTSHTGDTTVHITSTERDQWNSAKTYTDTRLAPVTTSGSGSSYTATVAGITALTAGVSFVMVPHVVSTTTTPQLNVNSLGAKMIRRRLSTSTSSTIAGSSSSWLGANKPIRVTYDGTYWIVDSVRPSASDLYGMLPITSGGTGAGSAAGALRALGGMPNVTVTTADAGKFLRVSSDGVWVAEAVPDAESASF